MRQRRVRWGKGESRRTRSFGRCLEFYLRHFTTVPRLRRHCSAVKSRNTKTVLSCDSPRSAADRGESVLKPLSAFFVSGRERCADIVPVFARPAPNSRGQRQSRSRSWRTHRSGYSTCFFTPKLLRDSAGLRRDSSGIRRDSSGILAGFKRDSAGFKRDSAFGGLTFHMVFA